MNKVIIYNQENGVPAVVVPTQEGLETMGIFTVAKISVPMGKPFKIVDVSELPNAPQEAWVVSDDDLTDGFGEASE
jgi:hypothetical protein